MTGKRDAAARRSRPKDRGAWRQAAGGALPIARAAKRPALVR